MTAAMEYGIKSEPKARDEYIKKTGMQVFAVGLVIKINQPFLACSPDGVILEDHSVLEIKRPYTCRNTLIFNKETGTCNVPYLIIADKDKISLKKSHKYYTQVQTSMYITGLDKCHFFVYSECDSVHIIIEKDKEFLAEIIPKIEYFYFKYFLPASN